jgi:hypothetical protein
MGLTETTGAGLLHHIMALSAAGALSGVLTAAGLFMLRRVWRWKGDAAGTVAIAAGVGTGVVGALMLGVSVIVAREGALWVTLATVAIVTRHECRALPALISEATREFLESWPAGLPRVAVVVGVGALGLLGLLIALGPPVDYDALAYHLRVPQQWLLRGRVYLPPDNYHTALAGPVQSLYLPLLAVRLAPATQVLNLALTLLTALGVFGLGKAVGGARVGAVAALILFASPIVLLVGTQPMMELPLLLPLVGATLALTSALLGRSAGRELYLAAALIGIGFGVKYHGLIYAIALSPVFVAAALRQSGRVWRRSLTALVVAVLVAAMAASPWIAKNVVMFGNPVFPVLSRVRVEPWLKPLYPDLRPPMHDSILTGIHRAMRRPITLGALFLAPASLEPDVDGPESAPYLPLLLAPLALMLPSRRRLYPVLLPPFLYLLLLLSYSRYTSIRYLLPALPGLAVGLSLMVHEVAKRMSLAGRVVLTSTLLVFALPTPLALLMRLRTRDVLGHAVGLTSNRAVLRDYWDTSDYADLVEWTDRNVPDTARTVLLFEARGFYFHVPVYEDLMLRNWAYLAPFAKDPECLRRTGLNYLIINEDGLRYFISRGVDPEALAWPAFDSFRQRCLIPRYRNAKFVAYELRN